MVMRPSPEPERLPLRREGSPVGFVQFGDFRAATRRFARGEQEVYLAQRFSVDYVRSIRERAAPVAVLCVAAQASY